MFQQSTRHVASYYAHTCADRLVDRAALEGEQDTEVLIIGAGFSGLHTALRLALAGKRVTLLEASRVAWAASGRNGGQAILGWSCDMPPLEAALGYERARRLWDGMRWAARELRDLPGRHEFDCDYRAGHLWTSVMPRRVGLLTEWQHEASHKWGHDKLQFIERSELPRWVASERYQAGLFDPEGGHLNPLKLALGLADAIERAGGRIHELSKALSYGEEGDGFVVTTERGRIRADVLVLACNAYLDRLDPQLASCVLPVGTYQVATAPLSKEQATALLPSNVCVTDNQFVLDYFRRTPDNRLLFGGGCTLPGRHAQGHRRRDPAVPGARVPATHRRRSGVCLGRPHRPDPQAHAGYRPAWRSVLDAGVFRAWRAADTRRGAGGVRRGTRPARRIVPVPGPEQRQFSRRKIPGRATGSHRQGLVSTARQHLKRHFSGSL